MFLLGSALFNLVMYASGALGSLWGQVLKRTAPERLLPLARGWSRLVFASLRAFCGIRIETEGLESLPPGPVLIAAQHQSALDTLIWLKLVDKPAYVLKAELLKLPLFGSLVLPAGQIAIDRSGGSAALRRLVADVQKAAAEGRQIIIFPEGTRVAPDARGRLQPGVFAIARATGLKVVPVATDSGRFWGRNAFRKRPGTVRIRVFPPLPEGLDRGAMLGALGHLFYDVGVDGAAPEMAGAALGENVDKSVGYSADRLSPESKEA